MNTRNREIRFCVRSILQDHLRHNWGKLVASDLDNVNSQTIAQRYCIRCYEKLSNTGASLCRPCVQDLLAQGLTEDVLVELYQRYDEVGYVVSNTHSQATLSDQFVDWIREHRAPTDKIVEVGSGGGFLANAIFEAGFSNIVATDFSPSPVAAIQHRFPHLDCRVMSALNLEFPTASVDVLISVETIEHLLDPAQHLDQAVRVLKPGGVYLVRTPNWLAERIYYRLTDNYDMVIWHPSVFSSRSLSRALRSRGFRVQHLAPQNLPQSQLKKLPRPLRPLAKRSISMIPAFFRPSIICAATKP